MAGIEINGTTASGFEGVRDAFEQNFTQYGDQGGSVAVIVDGETKVDLWGGTADVNTGRAWNEDSMALVYSVTKGATAVVANLLAERGQLELDAPVTKYWPAFGAQGKEKTTVRMLLSHRAGLPLVEAKLTREQVIAGAPVADALAAQAPIWEPGTSHGYHALTYGWLLNEVVRRATGRTVGSLFATEVAGPLGLDFYIGLPASAEGRVAPLINMVPPPPDALDAITDPDVKAMIMKIVGAMMDPNSLFSKVLSTNGALPTPDAATWNDPRVHQTEQPGANAITNARSLARMYAACVSHVDGVRLLSDSTLDDATKEQSAGMDEVLMSPSRFGTGFMLFSPTNAYLSPASFGHTGAGGAIGFADRDAKLGFGYVQNQLGGGVAGDPRSAGLIDSVRKAVGA
ncbi:MAG: serine hydrolase [Actinobacteria bacterium]|uniref:Unannotated protein n=1 Tax=freshwater metagenome TaxID=449393 RepID=A0A6J7MCD0_9ZZZZ|nr:serine hydrolase [Actinomycetota bacterium]MSX80999.1 serine hydrolase [Actinomycetota bacterium]